MGLASRVLKGASRKAITKVMDRVGSRLVERIADTSADAPSAFHKPKRDVYGSEKEDSENSKDAKS